MDHIHMPCYLQQQQLPHCCSSCHILSWWFFGTCLLRFKTIDKLRPFYDTIYAPYKDSFRWWFGARQFVLVVEYVIFAALAGTHISNLLLASYCLISIFALAQAWLSPAQCFNKKCTQN